MTTGVHPWKRNFLGRRRCTVKVNARATDNGPIACRRGSSTLLEATSSTIGGRRLCTFTYEVRQSRWLVWSGGCPDNGCLPDEMNMED